MPAPAITAHLAGILSKERIPAEDAALKLIAAAARGSMRDALSLLDQAIAYSAGSVTEAAVRAMLGTVDEAYLFDIVEGLLQGDAQAVLRIADAMEERTIAFDSALQELASLFHRLALARMTPAAIGEDDPNRVRILDLASRFDPEELQLDYQIAIHGRQDLPYAPDSYAGFTMALLRMLAFRPDSARPASTQQPPEKARRGTEAGKPVAAPGTLDWPELARTLNVGGIARQLAQQSALQAFHDGVLVLRLAPGFKHLAEKAYQDKLRAAVEQHLGVPVRLRVEIGDTGGGSAQDRATAAITSDEFVRGMMEQFDATIVESSIKPVQ
jgi:DNA polymerase-3 subunit gamma/tau